MPISDPIRDTNPVLFVVWVKSHYLINALSFFVDCLYGTYGVECRKTCNCKGGICDRETGACLTLKFFAKIASKLKNEPQAGKRNQNLGIFHGAFCKICWSVSQLSSVLWDVTLSCVFRGWSGLRRGPERRPKHGQIQLPEATQPSLTSADQAESSANVALTYKWTEENIFYYVKRRQTFLQHLEVLLGTPSTIFSNETLCCPL